MQMIDPDKVNLAMWRESVEELLRDPEVNAFADNVTKAISQLRTAPAEVKQELLDSFSHFAAQHGIKVDIDPETFVKEMVEAANTGETLLRFTADSFLPMQDKLMLDYANYWSEITDRHIKRGTYQRMHEFMGPADGLHLEPIPIDQ